MSKEYTMKRVLEESDFIKCAKFHNSLNRYLLANDNADDSSIARFLMIDEEKVEQLYQEAIDILRKAMLESEEEE